MTRIRHAAALALLLTIWLCVGTQPAADRACWAGDGSRPRVTLAAVGDVLFARGVGKQIARHGADHPFDAIRGIVRKADIGFCNLECALSTRGVPQHRRFQFRAAPQLAANLRRAGFTVTSLANNHTMDYGRDAMLDTISAVEKAGIAAVGAGANREEAGAPRFVKKNGLTVGFIAYTDITNAGVVRLDDRPTVAGIDSDTLAAEVRAAKAKCDCLVVSCHWGVEYMKRPTERQQMLARLAIDSGADLVLGHHPHVLQPSEVYKGKLVLYSLGAFVWDAKLFGADRSAIYIVELGKSSARLARKLPVRISGCRPSITAKRLKP